MVKTITVKAPEVTSQVVLWERNPDHPNGEIFVVADGKEYQVARTRQIGTLLGQGRLVEVEAGKSAKKEEPSAPNISTEPWPGYDKASAEDILARLDAADDTTRSRVLAYEQAKGERGRKTIIARIENRNS